VYILTHSVNRILDLNQASEIVGLGPGSGFKMWPVYNSVLQLDKIWTHFEAMVYVLFSWKFFYSFLCNLYVQASPLLYVLFHIGWKHSPEENNVSNHIFSLSCSNWSFNQLNCWECLPVSHSETSTRALT